MQSRLTPLYPNAKYSFDTNIYISIWRDYYPPDTFKKLYIDLEKLINQRIILSTIPVKIELERQRDKIYDFLKNLIDYLFILHRKSN